MSLCRIEVSVPWVGMVSRCRCVCALDRIAEKLHEMSPIFGTPQLAITKILDFAEVLNIPKAGRLVTPI